MPSLRRIPSPTKGGHTQRSCSVKSTTIKLPLDDDHFDDDDRFSQPPDDNMEIDEYRKKENSAARQAESKYSSNIAPFTIESAIMNYRNLLNPPVTDRLGSTGGIDAPKDYFSNSSTATDIVAVVLSTAIRQSPPPSGKSRGSSRIHLLIGDQSLPRGRCARVSMNITPSNISSSLASLLGVGGMGGRYENTSPINENALGQLQPGDVVRWNRLEVRNDYSNGSAMGKKRSLSNISGEGDSSEDPTHTLLSVTCDLSMSWRDPAAGPSLARLCRILPKSPHRQGMQWENFIHPSMETSKEIVTELASWYCANAMPHFSKATAILPTNQPCHRRKLRDINTSHLLSHIVVKVLRCEKAISTYSTPRKITKDLDSIVTHVTLSDGAESDDLLGMRGSVNHGHLPNSISTVLLQAMKVGSHVLLSHILSHSTNAASAGSGASLQCRELLILVPTRETTATTLTPDHPYYVREASAQEEENQFASQKLTLERASQLFSLTQQHSPPIIKNDSISAGHCRGVMVIVSSLMDIIIDGIDTSLMEGSHWQAPHRLSKFLFDSPIISTGFKAISLRPSYRSATLILDPKSVSSEILVNADGDAMKLLCMDVPVEDMGLDDSSITPNPYLCHIGELLKALCTERVPIRWVLEQESECNWFVTNATLLEI